MEEGTNTSKPTNKVWVILSIITIITLIAIGVYGFIVVRKFNKQISDQKDQINELNNKIKEKDEKISDLEKTQSSQAEQNDFFKITQFGVEFKLSSGLLDLKYILKDSNTVTFESPSLNEKMNKNATPAEACGAGSLGFIIRGKAGQSVYSTTYDKLSDAIKIGDYYYVYQQPGSGCGGGSADITLLQKSWNNMSESVRSLRAIK